mmetsp:Transcript_34685/g.85339  ORF Transcript_34685/g.85339 Transcript_34685/m.85339 type:complete len:150 (-) Transcript_34685:46-495(-)
MNPMVPGMQGSKMSSSSDNGKIDLLDTPEDVSKKIRKAFCEEGNVEGNGLLAFIRHVALPLQSLTSEGPSFTISRRAEDGGDVTFTTYAELEEAWTRKEIHPLDLKGAVAAAINMLLEPIRARMAGMVELVAQAYPPEQKGKGAGKEKK